MSNDPRWQRIFQYGEPFEKQTITWLNELEAAIVSGGGIQSISAADATIVVGGSAFDATLKVGLASISEAHLAFAVATQAELDAISLTPGPPGPTGATGATGPAGPGVPPGGTAGQMLAKVDATDFNTQWQTPTGGGGGITQIDESTPTPLVGLLRANGTDIDVDTNSYATTSQLNGKVAINSVLAAATTLVQNKFANPDTQQAFRITADGTIRWGQGGSTAPDTVLSRPSANMLRVDNSLTAAANLIANAALYAQSGLVGQVTVGPGNTIPLIYFGLANDTNLYRDAADVLATDDQFWIKGAAGLKFPDGTTQITAAAAGSGLPADTVVVAGTRIIANKLLAGDTQPSWRLFGDGKIEWGVGGATAPDTNLYRSATNQLTTDDAFQAAGNITTSGYFSNARISNGISYQTALVGDSANRFQIDNQGKMQWGGGTSLDVFLQRVSASILELDGSTGGILSIKRSTVTGVALQCQVGAETFSRFYLRRDGKQEWGDGTSVSANLYRQADGVLRMDGKAGTGAFLDLANDTAAMIRFGATQDTNLYRAAAADLQTDGRFLAKGDLVSKLGAATQMIVGDDGAGRAGIRFGSASDTTLYRIAAGQMQTDSYLLIQKDTAVANASALGLVFNSVTGGVKLVQCGAADSGGAGYRMLRIAN